MEKSDEGNGNSAWSSSDYDISGLSASEIRKLRKKGINPQLYAEMKAARQGKGKWIGPLVGNTFIGYDDLHHPPMSLGWTWTCVRPVAHH